MSITITITGTVASGKTTIGVLIAEALMNAGFNVINLDEDIYFGSSSAALQQQRINALTSEGIVIAFVQAPRG